MGTTLYISDLDGTLLDRHGILSTYTAQTVQRLIAEGGLFTIATSRSLQSCNDLIWLLGLRLPAVLTNGAMIYDSVNEDFLQINSIPQSAFPQLTKLLDERRICGFLYTMKDKLVSVYYKYFFRDWDKVYHNQNIERFQGRFYQCADLEEMARGTSPIFMVALGEYEDLVELQQEITHIQGISSELYYNVYDNNYFIDIFPATASKAKGMLTLQQMTGADEVVAFGDNFNDLSMLLTADRSYAPKNAVVAAKNVATDIIGKAQEDSVAHFLRKEMGWGQ